MTDETPCPHYCDNQGLCHCCGIMMDEWLWDKYINGPSPAKPETIKLRVPVKSPKRKKR